MGILDSLFGKGKSSFDASKSIGADTAAREAADKTRMIDSAHAAGQTGPYGSSQYSFDPVTGKPTGVNTQFTGQAADINTGLLGGLNTSVAGMTPDFSKLNPQDYLNARMGAHNAYADPARTAAEARWRQERAERGLDTGGEIDASKYGQIADADTRGRTAAFGDAYTALPGALATMTNTELQQKFAPAQMQMGLLQGMKGFLPQAAGVQSNLQSSDVLGAYTNEAKMNDQAEADRRAAIGNTIKGVAGLALAPYKPFGATNLGTAVSGGMGFFNNMSNHAPQGYDPSGNW